MSEMVRVRKDVADSYFHRPWSEVLAAAERGDDGICVASPAWTPWRRNAPEEIQYRHPNTGELDRARYKADLDAWVAEQDTCFLYEAESWTWPKDKTLLFQQNW